MKRTIIVSKIFILALLLLALSSCNITTTKPETGTVATPSFDVVGGSYSSAQMTFMYCTTERATIRYTTDGSEPNQESLLYYGAPILIYSDTTFKARAYKQHWTASEIQTEYYLFDFSDNFVLVEGSTFHNGSSDVTVSSFSLDKYELTMAEYMVEMSLYYGWDPQVWSWGFGGDIPVYNVSWFDAVEYCNRRSIREELAPCYSYSTFGTNPDTWPSDWKADHNNHINVSCAWAATGYRLPTEMEWMFAARGGNQTHDYLYSGSNTLDDVAWYISNGGAIMQAVGGKLPNELGLYDMSGNVSEWVWDIYAAYPRVAQTNPLGGISGYDRLSRGGSTDPSHCEVSHRHLRNPGNKGVGLGFRVCRAAF